MVLTLLGGTKRNPASGAKDLGILPTSVPLHSVPKVHAIAVVSMTTATTTASPTSTPHTPMLRSLAIQVASAGEAAEICHDPGINNNSSLSSNSSATTVMADGSGGASTGVLVYLHLVATGVTAVDNNGTSVVTALSMGLVVATSAVVKAMTATPLLPVVVVHRRIGQWRNSKMAAIMLKMIVGR